MQLILETKTAGDTKIIMSTLEESLEGKLLVNGDNGDLNTDINGYKKRIRNEDTSDDEDSVSNENEKVDDDEILLKSPTHNNVDKAALENPNKKNNLNDQAGKPSVMENCEESVTVEQRNDNSTNLHNQVSEISEGTKSHSANTVVETEAFDDIVTKQDKGDELTENENEICEEKDELTLLKEELAHILAEEKSEACKPKKSRNVDIRAMNQVCINEQLVKDKISVENKDDEASNVEISSSDTISLNNKKNIGENCFSITTAVSENIADVLAEEVEMTTIAFQQYTNKENVNNNSVSNKIADCGKLNNETLDDNSAPNETLDCNDTTEVISNKETIMSISHKMSPNNKETIHENEANKSEDITSVLSNIEMSNVINRSQDNKKNVQEINSSNETTREEITEIISTKKDISTVNVQPTINEQSVDENNSLDKIADSTTDIKEKNQEADDLDITGMTIEPSNEEFIKTNTLDKKNDFDGDMKTDKPPSNNKEIVDENKTADSKDITELIQKGNDDVVMTVVNQPFMNRKSVDANCIISKNADHDDLKNPTNVEMMTVDIKLPCNKECVSESSNNTASCNHTANATVPSKNKESFDNISSLMITTDYEEVKEILPNKVVQDSISIDSKGDISNVDESKNIDQKIIVGEKLVNSFPVCKLSNTLDILSDDEDEPPKEVRDKTDKQCINIEDDDDIMFIEDTNSGDSKTGTIQMESTNNQVDCNPKSDDSKKCLESGELKVSCTEKTEVITDKDSKQLDNEVLNSDTQPRINEKALESKSEKPETLLPNNFLKSAKKNLADMTRDDLEEFCILKIVESIVDRSNLSDIKTKLMNMAQNIDEYRKKAMMLTKQNRDLQVVLKSVQEEQKKAPNTPITPLKINRSVGMQVLMTEKPGVRRKLPNGSQAAQSTNSMVTRQMRNPTSPSPRLQKQTASGQNIPVPRLVPANSPVMKPPTTPQPVTNVGKTPSPVPNGPKNSSVAQKGAEKRPYNRVQSVTVDLTDDEPPTKINSKNSTTPPVRLVPSQNLLAPQRQPFGQSVNSPRKVYIPISGPQGQNIRPGHTIMLKSVPATGPRQRCPPPQMPKIQHSQVRAGRIHGNRHPAPLPDAMKQYQPPTWKALPPAPDLKLSKVENGIVISWKIEGYQEDSYEEIASYQLYAYQETSSPPSTALWKKIGDVKALPLPMACTLTQFMAGFKYYFAVRAVDIRSRLGPFSLPGSILLLNKM